MGAEVLGSGEDCQVFVMVSVPKFDINSFIFKYRAVFLYDDLELWPCCVQRVCHFLFPVDGGALTILPHSFSISRFAVILDLAVLCGTGNVSWTWTLCT